MKKLTRERLLELLEYNPITGKFYWNESRGPRSAGSVAGTVYDNGYSYIGIDRTYYRQCRLVWLYVFGKWPNHHIDHKNGNTLDDRLCNLRLATRSQNLGNRKLNANSTTGFKGVAKREDGRFRAYINKDNKRHSLGDFDTPEEAHSAYCKKAKLLFGEFARAR